MSKKKHRFILVDSNALVHRAYHAYPPELQTKTGEQVNAVYGFTIMLLKVIKDFKPDSIVCVFDSSKPTFRHSEFAGYKAHRKPIEESLSSQFPRVQQIVNAFDIPLYQVDGYEADDAIGSIARKISQDNEVIIVTGDHDILQLIDSNVKVYMAGRNFNQSKLYAEQEVMQRYSLKPIQIIDYKALKGDVSDNIPGVKGVGEKTAIELIKKYGSIEAIYQNIEEIKESIKKKLIADKDNAFMSKSIATIITNIDLDLDIKSCLWTGGDLNKLKSLFQELQFKSLIHMLNDFEINNNQVESKTTERDDFKINLIKDTKQIERLIAGTKNNGIIFIYALIEGVDPIDCKIKEVVLKYENDYLHLAVENLIAGSALWKLLAKMFADEKILKVGHNIKLLKHALKNLDFNLSDNTFDICIAYHLLNNGIKIENLSDIVFSMFGEVMDQQGQLGLNFENDDYLSKLLYFIEKIYFEIIHQFKNSNTLSKLFYEVEMPLTNVLYEMERNGITLDVKQVSDLKKKLEANLIEIKKSIYIDSGHEFNINSSRQVSEVIFNELNLPAVKKTKSGSYSTNEKILKKLVGAHPIIDKLLKYREYSKVKSTYTDTLIAEVNKNTNRIHTTYKQTYAVTGRLSSVKPNLQNIPIASQWGEVIRKAFIADKGKLFVSFDVSQQELRLLAHFSGEEKLIEAFQQNIDIHALTASEILGVKLNDVTKKQRGVGKVLNYSIIYGMSGFALSDMLEVSRNEAQKLIDTYFEKYKAVRAFLDRFLKEAESKSYVETLLGRRKSTQGLKSTNFQVRNAAIREILNFPLQGTAADLMKLAMIKVENRKVDNYNSKLMLQIHDELLFEVDEYDKKGLSDFIERTQYEMENVYKLKVPLLVEVHQGKNWAEV